MAVTTPAPLSAPSGLNNTVAQWVSWITTITHHLAAAVPGGQCAVFGSNIGEQLSLRDRRRPGRRKRGGDAKFVEQSLAMRRMSNYLKMTTTYLSVEPESWVPPAPPWFLGLVKNVRRNLPICTSSPLTSTAESTGSRLT